LVDFIYEKDMFWFELHGGKKKVDLMSWVDFIYENDLCLFFIARGQKVGLIEKEDSHVGDSIRLRKK
jgi:hypothetical protein